MVGASSINSTASQFSHTNQCEYLINTVGASAALTRAPLQSNHGRPDPVQEEGKQEAAQSKTDPFAILTNLFEFRFPNQTRKPNIGN